MAINQTVWIPEEEIQSIAEGTRINIAISSVRHRHPTSVRTISLGRGHSSGSREVNAVYVQQMIDEGKLTISVRDEKAQAFLNKYGLKLSEQKST